MRLSIEGAAVTVFEQVGADDSGAPVGRSRSMSLEQYERHCADGVFAALGTAEERAAIAAALEKARAAAKASDGAP